MPRGAGPPGNLRSHDRVTTKPKSGGGRGEVVMVVSWSLLFAGYRGVRPLFEACEFSVDANDNGFSMELWTADAEGQSTAVR